MTMTMTMTANMRSPLSRPTPMQKVVVLGATSGIALEVQRQLAHRGCEMLLVARSSQRLAAVQADLMARGAKQALTCTADLSSIPDHATIFNYASRSFPGYDTVLLAYGTMHDQQRCGYS